MAFSLPRVCATLVLVLACTGSETRLPTDTRPDTTAAPCTGNVDHNAAPQPQDAVVARSRGWTAGVQNAQVTVRRTGSTSSTSLTTDAAGRSSSRSSSPAYTRSASCACSRSPSVRS